jgi:hypothetical protein
MHFVTIRGELQNEMLADTDEKMKHAAEEHNPERHKVTVTSLPVRAGGDI